MPQKKQKDLPNVIEILEVDESSFRANKYTSKPFRAIGLVDVKMRFSYGIETVTLAYYRSSGTNDGKLKGLWYPIAGIKLKEGRFDEFTEYINFVLSNTTLDSVAIEGWLCKSVFFGELDDASQKPGFSNTKHYDFLLEIGEILQYLYKKEKYTKMKSLNSESLNYIVTSTETYEANNRSQRENFEKFIQDIYNNFK